MVREESFRALRKPPFLVDVVCVDRSLRVRRLTRRNSRMQTPRKFRVKGSVVRAIRPPFLWPCSRVVTANVWISPTPVQQLEHFDYDNTNHIH